MICSFICSQTLYASASSSSSSAADKDVQLKSHCDQLLLDVQKELEIQKDQVTRSQQELSAQREQVKFVPFTNFHVVGFLFLTITIIIIIIEGLDLYGTFHGTQSFQMPYYFTALVFQSIFTMFLFYFSFTLIVSDICSWSHNFTFYTTPSQTTNAQVELQTQKDRAARLQEEMSALRRRYEEKCDELTSFLQKYEEKSSELEEVRMKLQAEQLSNR